MKNKIDRRQFVQTTAAIGAGLLVSGRREAIGRENIEVSFEPDAALWDGAHANNLWALELPSPMTNRRPS